MTSKWIRSVTWDEEWAALVAELHRIAPVRPAQEIPEGQGRIAGLSGMVAGGPSIRPGSAALVMGRLAEAGLRLHAAPRAEEQPRTEEPARKRA